MYPEVLREHIQKCKKETSKPLSECSMLYPNIEEIMKIIVEEGVKIVLHRQEIQNMDLYLKKNGITVVHVVSSTVFALKAQNAGVDAIVAEGFEAGGHNGRDETTTFNLSDGKKANRNPVIAAGGIANGRGMLAAMVLGADAVQVGSRFAASMESSA
jgi:enoyl-[acyl-carrier protein] reductase II